MAAQVDPAAFRAHFGAGINQLDLPVSEQTVTVAKLMDIAPAGVAHPGAGRYTSTMFVMVGLLLVALVANALMRPVSERHHLAE